MLCLVSMLDELGMKGEGDMQGSQSRGQICSSDGLYGGRKGEAGSYQLYHATKNETTVHIIWGLAVAIVKAGRPSWHEGKKFELLYDVHTS